MPTEGSLSRSDRQAIFVFFILACAWSWPFFWWQVVHPASWNAWRLPAELKECFLQWGPGLAAVAVYYRFPKTRPRFLSLGGSSWRRSLVCVLVPVLPVWLVVAFRGDPRWVRVPYDFALAGFACLGEEAGWRGFLQGALRPLGKVRGGLVLALMWTAWHFNPTWDGMVSHVEMLLPATVVMTFFLAFLMERTGSLILAAAVHEWLDIAGAYSDYRLWVAVAAVPFWLWMAWTWPQGPPKLQRPDEPVTGSPEKGTTAEALAVADDRPL